LQAHFGEYLFDTDARELRRRGRAVALAPKAFALLEALLESRPRALRRQELHDRLWPRTFVAHNAVARLVSEVRRALGDRGREGWIRTVHGYGYAWGGEAEEAAPLRVPARASSGRVLRWGVHSYVLVEGANLIGRDPGCAVWIAAKGVSRRHACVTIEGARSTLEDLGSRNGTFLGGRRLAGSAPLADGAEILVGSELLTYWSAADGTTTGPPRSSGGRGLRA
jgi:DNA-binding winged helix-turn-helix (wHTH) protein